MTPSHFSVLGHPRGSTHHHQRWCPQTVGAPSENQLGQAVALSQHVLSDESASAAAVEWAVFGGRPKGFPRRSRGPIGPQDHQ
jgi:hypothetical protein